ncbi:MAG: bicyclomycin resistance protein [Methylibium sp. NZG]|nr:MAG: bicyclomycin resistance protein [Methylibium sp. NZG]
MRGVRRRLAIAACALALSLALPLHAQPAAPKVLRLAFPVAETGFDPAQISDIYSRTVTPHIFEALYTYDHLARPAKFKPLTAAAMPEVSSDFRTWTVRLRPGIYFADDAAFKGQRRELVAQDYVYSFKRFADPANKSPVWSFMEPIGYLGLAELRQQALQRKEPLAYDREIEGIRALDRYTIQFKLAEPRPRMLDNIALSDLFGAVAREVVEFYGDKIMAHPVGTGPFRLADWRRSSLIVLERNPAFREMLYDGEPAADDAHAQALLKRFKGRRVPMVDRVEVSIIDEQQPRWLSFLNGQADLIERLPNEFVNLAMQGGAVAPHLAKRGVHGRQTLGSTVQLTYFNMEDPVLGGYTPEKVALRRAISLGMDVEREIALVRRGQAVPAQSPISPHTTGYDPAFRSENGEYSVPRAKALLDVYGYVDKDGDGWRDLPDGAPLVLEMATQPDQQARQQDEVFRRDMDALAIRTRFRTGKWPEQLKAARAGKLMMWQLGYSSAGVDGHAALARLDGRQGGGQNLARFKRPEFDAIYDRMAALPDGPERLALFDQAKRISVAWAPYKVRLHTILTDLSQPWLIGYRRPLFWQEFWHTVDIDDSKRPPR